MSTVPPTDPPRSYADEASIQDEMLARKLAAIRAQVDSGEISLAEAAHLRIGALEHHIETTAALRREFFGGSE